MNQQAHAFAILTPDTVIDAVESLGLISDGRQLALNSYENRVYQVGLEEQSPIIAKFYRPESERWSDAQIQEEHDFLNELTQLDWPVVPALKRNGKSLFRHRGLRFALFEKKGGRAPELDNLDHLYCLGQHLARLHNIGASKPFKYRKRLDINVAKKAKATVMATYLPANLHRAYSTLLDDLINILAKRFAQCPNITWLRCHGDCHMGNVLWRDDKPHFVDFDDTCSAPAIQDLWMLLSGNQQEQQQQMQEILEGYEMFRPFDLRELQLIEPLRTLRMINYCAWLCERWHDPAFPMHFPWFNTERYWGEHILELREQVSALQAPSLQLANSF